MMTMADAYRRRSAEQDPAIRQARNLATEGELRYAYEIRPSGACVQKVFLPGGCMVLRFVPWVRA
jgi:hypothetical protein